MKYELLLLGISSIALILFAFAGICMMFAGQIVALVFIPVVIIWGVVARAHYKEIRRAHIHPNW